MTSLTNIAREALFELDSELRFRFISIRVKDILGYSPKELQGKSFLELVPTVNRKAIRSSITASEQSGSRLSLKVPLVDAKGERVSAVAHLYPVEKKGEGPGFHGALSLKPRSALAEEILEAVDEGVALVDKEGQVLYANRYAAGRLDLLPSILKQSEAKRQSDATPFNGRSYSYSVKEFKNLPAVEGWTVLFKDVTEVSRMRQMMTQIDRLSSLGMAAASLAHEIKNPLAGVKVMAQTLGRELEPDKKEFISRIVKQVNRIDVMISKLLSLAKPPQAKPRPTSLPDAVGEVELLLSDRLKKGKIRTVKELAVERVYADPDQVEQILFNLILNGIEAMPGGGVISVRSSRSSLVNPQYGSPYVAVSVTDQGEGLTEQELEHIFIPFYTTKEGGTGIGLFVVYQLVMENGGMVEAKSEPGTGSTFTLYLRPEKS